MASTNVNVGRVQGAGFFYSTYADDNVATTIDKGTVLSELTIFEKDMIVDAKGRLYEVTSILGDTINVEYKSTVQGEKGDKGDTGDVGTVILNAETTQYASFYAPTEGGSADDILIATGGEPTWKSDIKGFKFSIENLDMSESVSPSIKCTNYSITGTVSGALSIEVGTRITLRHQFTFTVSIDEPLDTDLYIVIQNATVSTSSNKYKYSSSNVTIGLAMSLTRDALVSSNNSTSTSVLALNTVCIPAGETVVIFTVTLTTTTTITEVETSTSGMLSSTTIYLEAQPYDVDSITELVASAVYVENGKSRLTCNDVISIDSTGKIECAELWVGGKQIT